VLGTLLYEKIRSTRRGALLDEVVYPQLFYSLIAATQMVTPRHALAVRQVVGCIVMTLLQQMRV